MDSYNSMLKGMPLMIRGWAKKPKTELNCWTELNQKKNWTITNSSKTELKQFSSKQFSSIRNSSVQFGN